MRLLLFALVALGCTHTPQAYPYVVACVAGDSVERREILGTAHEAAEAVYSTWLLASGGDPIDWTLPAGTEPRSGALLWEVASEDGTAGLCAVQRIAQQDPNQSFGDIVKAVLGARIESSTGVPAEAFAPGFFADTPRPGVREYRSEDEGRIRDDAYGPGLHADPYGRPGRWVTEQGDVSPGPVREDVYGPGVGSDPYGRPVRFETLDR